MAQQSKFDHSRRSEFHRAFAKELRKSATKEERRLWFFLRGKQFGQFKFRTQQTIGPFIADFFCASEKLIVELDGTQHSIDSNAQYDAERASWLQDRGYRVLRFSNFDVMTNIEGVLDGVWLALKAAPGPLPEPPSGGSTLPQGEGK